MSNISPKKLNFTIITTKQERFVTAILETNKITPPEKENIYDLENPYGAKTKVSMVVRKVRPITENCSLYAM